MLLASNIIINPEMAPWLVVNLIFKPNTLSTIIEVPVIGGGSIQHHHKPYNGAMTCCDPKEDSLKKAVNTLMLLVSNIRNLAVGLKDVAN